jgi:hypothetical protein
VSKQIGDGYGNFWDRCLNIDCSLEIVRPGKAQCDAIETSDGDWIMPCVWDKILTSKDYHG